MTFDEFVRSRSNDAQMETLQMCIEHLLRAEQQTHDERERIYHAVSSGRKLLAEGFAELLNNDRHGTAQRMGFLVGYASAFRMHSNFITQARNTYGGHELANYYGHPNGPGLHPDAAAYTEYRNGNPNTFSHIPNFPGRPSPGYRDIVERGGRPMTTVFPDQEVFDRIAAARNGHAETNGGGRVDQHAVTAVPQRFGRQLNDDAAVGRATNSFTDSTVSLNNTNGVEIPHDTVMSNRNSRANGNGASRDPVHHTTPTLTGTTGPHFDDAPSEDDAE
ncbi:hypothetical protein E8E11_003721 [Didymella keratinophila]|nr:hypothetical protein E8E11_003721 [Didymella keratinophila]